MEGVRAEAKKHAVEIAGTEIIGLVPKAAIERAAEYYLNCENFTPDLVIENRLADALQR
jgi:glutamate formiminotransferase